MKPISAWLLLFALCLHLTSASAQTKADTSPAQYRNPVWARDFPDPFVLFYQGKFYAYATQNTNAGFQAMVSPDLVNWTHKGAVYKPDWAQSHYWAPEMVLHKGRFYLIYSALNPKTNKHDIAAAVGDTPLGPFKHHAFLVEAGDNRVGVIDATVFTENNVSYLIYSEETPRRIVMRKLKPDFSGCEDERTELMKPDKEWESGITEAPTMLKRGNEYILFYSGGWYQSGKKEGHFYGVSYAIAKSLRGPYVKSDKLLVQTVEEKVYSPGHQCIIQLPSGQTWMLYHAWDAQNDPRYGSNPLGRTLRLDQVLWENNRPVMRAPSIEETPVPLIETRKSSPVGR